MIICNLFIIQQWLRKNIHYDQARRCPKRTRWRDYHLDSKRRGFFLRALKQALPTKELLEQHYSDLSAKPFFPKLIEYMLSGPVVCMVWEGKGVVATGRKMLGETNPLNSAPGTIRGDFCIDVGRNICHGSDSVESAKKEIALWFKPEEVNSMEISLSRLDL
jgi:nucleoside-diphosphate kinase